MRICEQHFDFMKYNNNFQHYNFFSFPGLFRNVIRADKHLFVALQSTIQTGQFLFKEECALTQINRPVVLDSRINDETEKIVQVRCYRTNAIYCTRVILENLLKISRAFN